MSLTSLIDDIIVKKPYSFPMTGYTSVWAEALGRFVPLARWVKQVSGTSSSFLV